MLPATLVLLVEHTSSHAMPKATNSLECLLSTIARVLACRFFVAYFCFVLRILTFFSLLSSSLLTSRPTEWCANANVGALSPRLSEGHTQRWPRARSCSPCTSVVGFIGAFGGARVEDESLPACLRSLWFSLVEALLVLAGSMCEDHRLR